MTYPSGPYPTREEADPDYYGLITPQPMTPTAQRLFELMQACKNADQELTRAEKNTPDYLPTCSPAEYRSREIDARNRAYNALAEFIGPTVYKPL
jgi:hypothetical protein